MRLPNGYGSVYKMHGKRRRPWVSVITKGYENEKQVRINIGYSTTKEEALSKLSEYSKYPYSLEKITFKEAYEMYRPTIKNVKERTILNYEFSFSVLFALHNKDCREINSITIQRTIDKFKYSTAKKSITLINKVYTYLNRYHYQIDLPTKNIYLPENVNKVEKKPFTEEEIQMLVETNNLASKIALILIYSGVRINELLSLKCENIHIEEQYFDVLESKTNAGIRKVPIHNKTLPFFTELKNGEYLIKTVLRVAKVCLVS